MIPSKNMRALKTTGARTCRQMLRMVHINHNSAFSVKVCFHCLSWKNIWVPPALGFHIRVQGDSRAR
jgi:hypothetical protein